MRFNLYVKMPLKLSSIKSKLKLRLLIAIKYLRMFALIVSAHPYCACKFTSHVMHGSVLIK